MAVVVVVIALFLPIGWHLLLTSEGVDPWLKRHLGGGFLLPIAGYFASFAAAIGLAQSMGVGGQALVAFALSLAAVTLFRYLNGEDIELG